MHTRDLELSIEHTIEAKEYAEKERGERQAKMLDLVKRHGTQPSPPFDASLERLKAEEKAWGEAYDWTVKRLVVLSNQ